MSRISLLELILRAKEKVGLSDSLVDAVAYRTLPVMKEEQYKRLRNSEFLNHFVTVCPDVDLRGLITCKGEVMTKAARVRDEDGVGVGQAAADFERPAKVGRTVTY